MTEGNNYSGTDRQDPIIEHLRVAKDAHCLPQTLLLALKLNFMGKLDNFVSGSFILARIFATYLHYSLRNSSNVRDQKLAGIHTCFSSCLFNRIVSM